VSASRFISPSAIRWAATLPVALLAAVSPNLVISLLMHRVFDAAGTEWVHPAGCLAAPFMGAAFVGAACWVAPSRQRLVAVVALAVVVVWALVATVRGAPVWGPIAGALGVGGAFVPTLRTWRRVA